jgi:excisionase family DNA binding protein
MAYPVYRLSEGRPPLHYLIGFTLSTYSDDVAARDWISQAEAARIRGVSRQAIWKLVKQGRLRSLAIGGRTLVHRADVVEFEPRPPGRPAEEREH